jgi:DNA repair photolyase
MEIQKLQLKELEPIILSASRATDIPAFHANWLIERLKSGFSVWQNPFNGKNYKVSFRKAKAIVFWTKNPLPLLPFLNEIEDAGLVYYFLFTLNDYEKEGFEPNIPALGERISTFQKLSSLVGKERVIWRFDPLILTPELDLSELLRRIERIGNELYPFTEKLIFSFVEMYRKVKINFRNLGDETIEWTDERKYSLAENLQNMNKNWDLQLRSCATGLGLEKFGIEHNRCIDAELLAKISHDADFLSYLGYGKDLFGKLVRIKPLEKDKGQREFCGCFPAKDIGQYNTCPHSCIYCYANKSQAIEFENTA